MQNNQQLVNWVLTDTHPPFKLGMSSNTVLTVAKLSKRKPVKNALKVGDDINGYIVKWFYSDVQLTFKRIDNQYRITKMEIKEKNVKRS